jgi:polysaccharide export outer membrane protein
MKKGKLMKTSQKMRIARVYSKPIRYTAFALFVIGILTLNAYAQQEEQSLPVNDYKIGTKDLLEIRVFELPELSQTVRVAEDGSVSLSLLGKVDVVGLTAQELEKRLASILDQKYTKAAHVTVFIKEYQKVSVLGAVGSPGNYELVGPTTLLQIIAQAKGLTPQAMGELYILRQEKDGRKTKITVNLEDLNVNGNQALNIDLQPNDVVNIPIDRMLTVYVYGQVKNPGALQFWQSKRITLLQAIAQAGGTTEWAKTSRVMIKRKDKRTGKETKFTVNLNNMISGKTSEIGLEEGDIVIVP